jgi:hypothetical protein
MGKLKRRILEEMIYERLLAAVDPESLQELVEDLDRSAERALQLGDGSAGDADELKLTLVRGALARLEEAICDLVMGIAPGL